MRTDKLWAPWRINYVQVKRKKGCIFCRAGRGYGDYVIFKTAKSICMLNIYPYNNGHLMVAPLRHTGDIAKISDREALDLWRCVRKAAGLLEKALRPHGFNIGINVSDEAGAGVPGHLHIHIVPRWRGDTNFMPVISGTKVISQSLDELASRLKAADKQGNRTDARR